MGKGLPTVGSASRVGLTTGRSASRGVCIGEGGSLPTGVGGLYLGGSASRVGFGQTPPPFRYTWDTTGYDQEAGGTHPTGMISCSYIVFHTKIRRKRPLTRVAPVLDEFDILSFVTAS